MVYIAAKLKASGKDNRCHVPQVGAIRGELRPAKWVIPQKQANPHSVAPRTYIKPCSPALLCAKVGGLTFGVVVPRRGSMRPILRSSLLSWDVPRPPSLLSGL